MLMLNDVPIASIGYACLVSLYNYCIFLFNYYFFFLSEHAWTVKMKTFFLLGNGTSNACINWFKAPFST